MPMPKQVSLNAVRVFALVAKHESISDAAMELNLTSSAVSHQIKSLELSLAMPLFVRRSNSISLTDTGQVFWTQVRPGIEMVDHAVQQVVRDANELTIRIGTTLAVRWLIPALEEFKTQHPQARIRVETSHLTDVTLGQSADLAITYRPHGKYRGEGELLMTDFCRPVVASSLLEKVGYSGSQDVCNIPALLCTEDNWDWSLWATKMAVPLNELSFSDQFDIDDAAIRAASAGLGMTLAPTLVTQTEIDAGVLVALPGFAPVELGRYYLLHGPRRGGIVGRFRKWLVSSIADAVNQSV